jgi:hypothetical protein
MMGGGDARGFPGGLEPGPGAAMRLRGVIAMTNTAEAQAKTKDGWMEHGSAVDGVAGLEPSVLTSCRGWVPTACGAGRGRETHG